MLISKEKKKGRNRLAWEILGFLVLALIFSGLVFCFLYTVADSIAAVYLLDHGLVLTQVQEMVFHLWLRSLCLAASCVFFLFLFLFLLGRKISYLVSIIRGIEILEQENKNHKIPLEGKDELTELAQRINYLAEAWQSLEEKEKEIKEEREAWIRSVSHDIRTPLTSILSYSQFMRGKESLAREDMDSYISLVESKAGQIRALADGLMGQGPDFWEPVEDGRLLLQQLAAEWEEVLENQFLCKADLDGCLKFSGKVSVRGLRRVLDNLVSNTEKYADCRYPVELAIKSDREWIFLKQKNKIRPQNQSAEESHKIGLDSIRQIAAAHGGSVQVRTAEDCFEIEISLRIRADL